MRRLDLKKHFLKEYQKLPAERQEEPLFVAVSGGMDSCILAHVMLSLRDQLPPLYFLHVNYHLRKPDSNREQAFLKAWFRKEGAPLDVKSLFPQKKPRDLQAWARKERLKFFSKITQQRAGGRGWVCLAHHQRDQAETILSRLLRGSKLQGLGGMDPMETLESLPGVFFKSPLRLFRPFLEVPYQSLQKYALDHRLKFYEDRSNQTLVYLRNRLRHQVLPLLLRENPRVLESLAHLGRTAERTHRALETLGGQWLQKNLIREGKDIKIPILPLKKLPTALQEEVFRLFLKEALPEEEILGRWISVWGEESQTQRRRNIPLKGRKQLEIQGSWIRVYPLKSPLDLRGGRG